MSCQEPKRPCTPCPVFLGAPQTQPQPSTPCQSPRAASLYPGDAAAGLVSSSPQPYPAQWWAQTPVWPYPTPRQVSHARAGPASVPLSAALLDLTSCKFNTSPKPLLFVLPSAPIQTCHEQLMGTLPSLPCLSMEIPIMQQDTDTSKQLLKKQHKPC